MPSVAHDIPEFIVHKIMLQSYALSPHPTAVIIKKFLATKPIVYPLIRRVIVFNCIDNIINTALLRVATGGV